jgi:xylulokinase
VITGAGDQAAQSIGTGITGPGTISVTIGTSGVVFAATDSYVPDAFGRLHAYCHAAPGKWHLMGVTLSAGGSLRWFRDTLCDSEKAEAEAADRDAYDLMTEAASRVPAGSEGLLFLPYLSGERTPHPDPDARGVFFGLSLRHSKAHMTRAVLEGVTFSLRQCLDLLCSLGVCLGRVRVSGGGARSVLWSRLLADILNFEVVELNITQGACYGAALLAGVGTDVYHDVDDACYHTIREVGSTWPGANRQVYDRFFERYQALYPALKAEYAAMARTLNPDSE